MYSEEFTGLVLILSLSMICSGVGFAFGYDSHKERVVADCQQMNYTRMKGSVIHCTITKSVEVK